VEQRKQKRGWHEYFEGFRANCESVPRLPMWAVRWALDDPRQVPYLLVWRWMERYELREILCVVPGLSSASEVHVERLDGTSQQIQIVGHSLPRNGGTVRLLVCSSCDKPRLHLYGWKVRSERVFRSLWRCRTCAGLRYQSEGTYISSRMRFLGGYPRTPPWDPWAFANLEDARTYGICHN